MPKIEFLARRDASLKNLDRELVLVVDRDHNSFDFGIIAVGTESWNSNILSVE